MSQKRVVCLQNKGRLAGVPQILGVHDPDTEGLFPPFLPLVVRDDGSQFACSLVSVYPRFALYREIMSPAENVSTFNPQQE